ncbi:MAG: trypsin-like serine peptidase [Candidatus Latescibacterota bacterium]
MRTLKSKKQNKLLFLFGIFTALDVTPSSAWAQATEKVIGENDFVPVAADAENLPMELQAAVSAVGQLNIGCTATHIGGGLVLTAGHCVTRSPRARSKGCPQLGVIWGNYGGNKKYSVSKCITVEAREYNDRVDYAVLRVANPPSAVVEVDWEPQAQNISATILSFPRMRPMEWSPNCATHPYMDPVRAVVKFSHSCDTEGGSSGAPIFSADTFKMIGIHGGAGDELNYAMFVSALSQVVEDIRRRPKP